MGSAAFDELLAGAATMDRHFAEAPPERNMPMLMGLIGLWHHNFCGGASRAVISYEHGLALLPPYLQQLEMESLGKSVTQKGKPLRTSSGTVVWGNLGIEAQHAYMQALHQGTQPVACDFIAPIRRYQRADESGLALQHQHELSLANCFAQSRGLMLGDPSDDGHRHYPGNQPSNTLLLGELTPYSMGQLIALYEHQVYVA